MVSTIAFEASVFRILVKIKGYAVQYYNFVFCSTIGCIQVCTCGKNTGSNWVQTRHVLPPKMRSLGWRSRQMIPYKVGGCLSA